MQVAPAPTPAPATFPVAPMLAKLATSGLSRDVSYNEPDQQSMTMHVSYVPTPAGFRRASQLAYGPGPGVAPSAAWVDLAYTPSTRTFSGIQGVGFTGDVEQATAAPELAKVGDIGSLLSGSAHDSEPFATDAYLPVTRFSYDWSLEPASAQTAWLCLALSKVLSFGTSSDTDCFEIDPTGNILGFKSISESGYHGSGRLVVFR